MSDNGPEFTLAPKGRAVMLQDKWRRAGTAIGDESVVDDIAQAIQDARDVDRRLFQARMVPGAN